MRDIYTGRNIKVLRKSKKINQKELGEHLGITYTQISNYESGRSEISLITAIKIADYFDIDLESLVYKDFEKDGISKSVQLTPTERMDAFDKHQDKMPEDMREAIHGMIVEEFEKYKKDNS